MKTKLLSVLALTAMVLSTSVAANAATHSTKATAKPVASAEACTNAKDLKAKKALGCKLTKEEKAELKKEKSAAKHS